MRKKIYKNGIYYTPQRVADELVKELNNLSNIDSSKKLNILDPACGEGALLKALADTIGNNHNYEGCDLFEPKRKLIDFNFIKTDFFEYKPKNKFDLVITNPPFIQFGRLDEELRSNLFESFSKDIPISRRCDLWVYFLIKSILHLKKDGSIAAILPWSFMEADFAHLFRKWVSDQFFSTKVLLLNDKHFEGTEKRVILLWLNGFKHFTSSVKVGFSDSINDIHDFIEIENSKFALNGLIGEIGFDTNKILNQAVELGYKPFHNYAEIKIGIVTGANSYFIKVLEEAKKLGFYEKNTLIYTTTYDLTGLISKKKPTKVLLNFRNKSKEILNYMNYGVELGIDNRSHCINRAKQINRDWVDVIQGELPDAFFAYRASKYPYLSLNSKKCQCTNSIHRIYFNKDITNSQKKWIALSTISSVSQIALEHYSRHYGNGMMKVEPSALKQTLVYVPNDKVVDEKIFVTVSNLLTKGERKSASLVATKYIFSELSVDIDFYNKSLLTLVKIQKRRK